MREQKDAASSAWLAGKQLTLHQRMVDRLAVDLALMRNRRTYDIDVHHLVDWHGILDMDAVPQLTFRPALIIHQHD